MNANLTGFRTITHFHRLDATKNPKQIDITVTAIAGVYGPDVPIKADARIQGVIKGIYTLDAGELRLCLGEMAKDRPTTFAAKAGQSELLILHGGPRCRLSSLPPRLAGARLSKDSNAGCKQTRPTGRLMKFRLFGSMSATRGNVTMKFTWPRRRAKSNSTAPGLNGRVQVSILSGPWPAGRQYDDFEVRVTLEAPWTRDNKPIALQPGKHKIRVAYVTLDRKQPVRVVSNAVEIQVAGQPKAKEQEPAANLQPQKRKHSGLFARWQSSAGRTAKSRAL